MAQLNENNTTQFNESIAVIGMAGVFANAQNLQTYWQNILDGVDCMIDVPESRWSIADYYSSDKQAEDKTYCKRGGFIPSLDFDPLAYGLPPNILEVTDISQLLSLIIAKDVLEDAGLGSVEGTDRDDVGVVLGVGGGLKQVVPLTARLQYPVWDKVLKASGVCEADRNVIIAKLKKAYIL